MENDTAIWQIATWICGNFVPRESVKQEQDVERIILKIIIFAYCKFHVHVSHWYRHLFLSCYKISRKEACSKLNVLYLGDRSRL